MYIIDQDRVMFKKIKKGRIDETYPDDVLKKAYDEKSRIMQHAYGYGSTARADGDLESLGDTMAKVLEKHNKIYNIVIDNIRMAEFHNQDVRDLAFKDLLYAVESGKRCFDLSKYKDIYKDMEE